MMATKLAERKTDGYDDEHPPERQGNSNANALLFPIVTLLSIPEVAEKEFELSESGEFSNSWQLRPFLLVRFLRASKENEQQQDFFRRGWAESIRSIAKDGEFRE